MCRWLRVEVLENLNWNLQERNTKTHYLHKLLHLSFPSTFLPGEKWMKKVDVAYVAAMCKNLLWSDLHFKFTTSGY